MSTPIRISQKTHTRFVTMSFTQTSLHEQTLDKQCPVTKLFLEPGLSHSHMTTEVAL